MDSSTECYSRQYSNLSNVCPSNLTKVTELPQERARPKPIVESQDSEIIRRQLNNHSTTISDQSLDSVTQTKNYFYKTVNYHSDPSHGLQNWSLLKDNLEEANSNHPSNVNWINYSQVTESTASTHPSAFNREVTNKTPITPVISGIRNSKNRPSFQQNRNSYNLGCFEAEILGPGFSSLPRNDTFTSECNDVGYFIEVGNIFCTEKSVFG